MSKPLEQIERELRATKEMKGLEEIALRVKAQGFTLRQASPKDIPILERIALSQAHSWRTDAFTKQINTPHAEQRVLVIANEDDNPIAYAHYSLKDHLSISQIAVIEKHQKTGLGLLLTYAAFKHAAEIGVKDFGYDVEVEVSGFYNTLVDIHLKLPPGFPLNKDWFNDEKYKPSRRMEYIESFRDEEDDPLASISGSVAIVVTQLAERLPKVVIKEEEDAARLDDLSAAPTT